MERTTAATPRHQQVVAVARLAALPPLATLPFLTLNKTTLLEFSLFRIFKARLIGNQSTTHNLLDHRTSSLSFKARILTLHSAVVISLQSKNIYFNTFHSEKAFLKTTTMSALHTSAKVDQVVKDNDDLNQKNRRNKAQPTSPWAYLALVSFAVISYATMPSPLQPHHGEEPSIQHVFYYGWLTAISTGLGAVPLAFAPNLASYWVGISNGE